MSVYRNTKEPISIKASEIVVGDIIKFHPGMIIPADCILIKSGHPGKGMITSYVDKIICQKSDSDIILVDESDVTGDQKYKVKTEISQTSLEEFKKVF